MDTRDFTPRYAIVTGGSSGIGSAICIALAEAGMDVGFTYHSHVEGAEKIAEAIRQSGQQAFYRPADFSQLPESCDVIDELAEDLGGLDVFVANAGGEEPGGGIDFNWEGWRKIVALNLDAPTLAIHKAAIRMKDQGLGGRIIAITSVHEHVAAPFSLAYAAAKHGMGGVVKNLALELTPRYAITVNAVAPGEIATPINGMDDSDADAKKNPRPAVPVGRPGMAREVADVVAFLASPKSSFVTGASWLVDGGFEIMTPFALDQYRKEFMVSPVGAGQ